MGWGGRESMGTPSRLTFKEMPWGEFGWGRGPSDQGGLSCSFSKPSALVYLSPLLGLAPVWKTHWKYGWCWNPMSITLLILCQG